MQICRAWERRSNAFPITLIPAFLPLHLSSVDEDIFQASEDKQANLDELWNPKIVLDNTVGEAKETVTMSIVQDNAEAFVVEKRQVKATFHETMELYHFPFDTQVDI